MEHFGSVVSEPCRTAQCPTRWLSVVETTDKGNISLTKQH